MKTQTFIDADIYVQQSVVDIKTNLYIHNKYTTLLESNILNVTVALEETIKKSKNYYVILVYVEEMFEDLTI